MLRSSILLAILSTLCRLASTIRCWQCASVDGSICPNDAKLIDSSSHNACITWKLANGTVLLQNVVRFDEECLPQKIKFWSNFIDLYYKDSGGAVKCCRQPGCNNGLSTPSSPPMESYNIRADYVPTGRPPLQPQISDIRQSKLPPPPPSPPRPQIQPNNLPGAPLTNFFATSVPATQQSLQAELVNRFQQQQTGSYNPYFAQNAYPSYALPPVNFPPTTAKYPYVRPHIVTSPSVRREGNCQQYFDKVAADEWMPKVLIPLTFDRASETKVAIFYAKFKNTQSNNDHLVVRLIGEEKSNRTMYTFKLFEVGSVSVHVSKLDLNNDGTFRRDEVRHQAENDVINITDTRYSGFWITVNEEELAFGRIGQTLTDPVLVWKDTLREGPSNPYYFGLTTDQSSASYGINCDVPNLHFSDTCVEDEDCAGIPNTVCRNEPVNAGLDPGTRKLPFTKWKERDSLLRSCFCKPGHVRIPHSTGCYDPIRRVVTVGDTCFADYHCNDLPNTYCKFDSTVPKYNHSCQCVQEFKPFVPDLKTGLIEGCSALTKADKYSILGCGQQFKIEDSEELEWVPDVYHPVEFDTRQKIYYAVVYIHMNDMGLHEDEAVLRLLDENRNNRKMLTIKFSQNGKISIGDATRTSSFFFENERDIERASVQESDIMTKMSEDYVGFWIRYNYGDGTGEVSIGLNGSPFSSEYALVTWVDSSDSVMRNLGFIGFTASSGATVKYGAQCILQESASQASPFGSSSIIDAFRDSSFNAFQQYLEAQELQKDLGLQAAASQNHYSAALPPTAYDYLSPQQTAHQTAQQSYNTKTKFKEDSSEPTIIEPIIRNQYLTKLQTLLPTFFEDFDEDELTESLEGPMPQNIMRPWRQSKDISFEKGTPESEVEMAESEDELVPKLEEKMTSLEETDSV